MSRRSYSYELERAYYAGRWPVAPAPHAHLGRWIGCWLDATRVFAERRVLDLGAGECAYGRLIAEAYGPRAVVACDLFQERMLPAVRASREPRLRFVVGDAFALPFQSGAFDVVWGGGVLSQLPDLGKALTEIARLLRPSGLYVGWEPNPFNAVVAGRNWLRAHSPNQYLFWPWRFRRAFAGAGFQLRVRYYWVRLPRARSRLVGTCVGLVAERKPAA